MKRQLGGRLGADTGPSVNAEMVVLARERRGMTQNELANRLGVSQAKISKVEAGILPVDDAMLEQLCVVLRYPAHFFRLTLPVYGPGASEFFHRKRQNLSAKVLAQVHAEVNIRRIHLTRLLRAAAMRDHNIKAIDLDEFDGDVSKVAQAVRAAWGLPNGPVANLTEVVEEQGGIVIRYPFGTRQIDAISRWFPGLPPLFLMNADIPTDRYRFTLAHELGHITMHQVPRPDMEKEANVFASELLMPSAVIRAELRNAGLPELARLKPRWRVSMNALLKQASDLGAISDGRSRYLWIQMGKLGYRMREPAELDLPEETPSGLDDLIEFHRSQLDFDDEGLAQVAVLTAEEFAEYYEVGQPRLKIV